MPKRSQEENLSLLLEALRHAGDAGLTVSQIKTQVFSDTNFSNTDIKKLLENLRNKGLARTRVGKLDVIFSIVPGK